MFDKATTPIANKATSPVPEPAVQQKRPRGRPRSNPNDPKWLNAPTPVARPATAKRGIPKDDDAFKPTEYFQKKAEERAPAQPRKSKRARTLVYESLNQEVIVAKALGEIPEPLDNARAPTATQEPTPKDSIVVPAENPSGHHHNNNDERFGRGYRASRLPTPPDSSPDNDDNKRGRMGPPPPRRSGILSPPPNSPPNPARVPGTVLARPAPVPAAPVPVARVPVAPAPVVRVPAARVPAARVPVVPAPVVPAPAAPVPAVPAPFAPVPAPIAAPIVLPAAAPARALNLNDFDDPLGIGAALVAEMDAFIDVYFQPFELPQPYVNQWDAWRAPGPFNAWQQPERHFFREAMAAHPARGMCLACQARYGNGVDVLEELLPAEHHPGAAVPCCWAWPGNQYMGAQ